MAATSHSTLPDPLQDIADEQASTMPDFEPQDDDGGDYCRICRGEATEEQPLFYPCKCSGSIRYVHQDCLMEWLAHSKKKFCELCKTPFRFTKLYDKSMPPTLPFPLFLHQLALHVLKTLLRWSRYILVITVWFVCLPWCIRQVWRGLFWLADGTWLSETQYRASTLRQLNATLADLERMNASIAENGVSRLNRTLLESLLNSTMAQNQDKPPSLSSIFTSILRVFTGETIVSKVLRFVVGVPPVQISSPSKSNVMKTLVLRRPAQRLPSLLSNVGLLKNLTSFPAINHLSIDVLEGLLICLGLVAGFILVFLIREWVINQQPMLNIPDPDAAENQPAANPVNNANRPIRRPRRRRILPGAIDQGGPPPAPGDQVAVEWALHRPLPPVVVDQAPWRPLPGIPRRRALTDDNIAVPVPHEHDRPELPTRANSLLASSPVTFDQGGGIAEHIESHPSPPPLLRGALGDVINVHRNIQEGVTESEQSRHPLQLVNEPERINLEQGLSEAGLTLSTSAAAERVPRGRRWSITAQSSGSQRTTDSDESTIPTPSSANGDVQANHSEEHNSIDEVPPAAGVDPPDSQPERLSLVESLAKWLWHVDGQDVSGVLETDDDTLEIIEDFQAEAPFLPMQHGAIVPPGAQPRRAVRADLQVQPPQDHAPIQIEWDNQNAAEDAEDLEGVLELIGMEGPLIGMIQNVIFSLFLITLTLTASIWIPYVWGKLVLIFLAHPMAVSVKGPILLISNIADLIADLCFFTLGILGLLFNHLTKLVKMLTKHIIPPFSNFLDTELFEELALNVTRQSGARLENTLAGAAAAVTLNSDLPTFSMESHRALISFKTSLYQAQRAVATAVGEVYASVLRMDWSFQEQRKWASVGAEGVSKAAALLMRIAQAMKKENIEAAWKFSQPSASKESSYVRESVSPEWSTQDKIIAIILGYAFFALVGVIFLKISRLFYGLRKDEKVPGAFADSLRQAGGVLKVVVIIGIEMLVFPLYCGMLLDLALLPLFEGSTVWTRLAFIRRAPFTGLFLHWFIGTCYMFHFALFVSMCRKILRKGVLYFIRDPDDPTFHPVRDVLERPVPTQLRKIAFSALVYGGLVIMCLGGVVWGVGCIDGLLPIRWSTPEPRLAFPVDVVFYNFMLPFIIRRFEPSKKLAAVYEWWFRGCAHGLRLSHFLFGEEREEEKRRNAVHLPWAKSGGDRNEKDGTYVRAPGSDSCRIPKGKKVFLEVTEDNERTDGKPDQENGLYGRADEKWMKIYIPPKFKARLAAFVALLWIFAAGTGVTLTISPLIVGRNLVKWMSGSAGPVNDLYSLTIGLHVLGGSLYIATNLHSIHEWIRLRAQKYFPRPQQALPCIWSTAKYTAGLLYLLIALGIIFPLTISLIAELYIHIPIFTILLETSAPQSILESPHSPTTPTKSSSATIFILQTWALGLLYERFALRLALTYPSPHTRIAIAIRSIIRHSYMRPDIRLATRAIIIPLAFLCVTLLAAPLGYARLLITLMRVQSPGEQIRIYRIAYPGLLGVTLSAYGMAMMKKRMDVWRVKIRDEVYLVGEKLHNYVERREKKFAKGKGKVAMPQPVQREVVVIPRDMPWGPAQ